MKNWKTSVTGIMAILVAVANVITFILDGNPATNPDWLATFSAIAAGIGLMVAKDNNVTHSPNPVNAASVTEVPRWTEAPAPLPQKSSDTKFIRKES